MAEHTRYAVYFLPPPGALAEFGAAWLGWDIQSGRARPQPDVDGIADLTATPRRYGFHGTLKPPFRLAPGKTPDQLRAAVGAVADQTAGARLQGLALSRLGRFFALTPVGDTAALGRIAAACVQDLDGFRAPLTEAELAKRRAAPLSGRQHALLAQWGYPYVLDQFRFHLTLTGRVARAALPEVEAVIAAQLPPLPTPFDVSDICLCAQRRDGQFELLERFALRA